MHFAVGDRDGRCDAVGRRIGERGIERAKQGRASGLTRIGRGANLCLADFDIHFLELLAQVCQSLFGIGLTRADIHALRAVDDEGDDIGQALARLLDDQGIGQGEQDDGERYGARNGAIGAAVQGNAENQKREPSKARHQPERQMRCEGDSVGEHGRLLRFYLPKRSSRAGTWTWSVL
jgi:hypothetical protein